MNEITYKEIVEFITTVPDMEWVETLGKAHGDFIGTMAGIGFRLPIVEGVLESSV